MNYFYKTSALQNQRKHRKNNQNKRSWILSELFYLFRLKISRIEPNRTMAYLAFFTFASVFSEKFLNFKFCSDPDQIWCKIQGESIAWAFLVFFCGVKINLFLVGSISQIPEKQTAFSLSPWVSHKKIFRSHAPFFSFSRSI